MGQAIRPSQFILSYGVGSIIESQRGPRLIPIFEKWDLSQTIFSGSGSVIARFRINDPNARAQLNGGEIFEIPTNPEFDLPTTKPLFRTLRFPRWALCVRHRILYKIGLHGISNCPECRGRSVDAQEEAIRFVRACPNGHLDDVDWFVTVHGGQPCNGNTFDWVEETGSDLKNVRIRCKSCPAEVSLQDIYYRTSKCSGNFPEGKDPEDCDEKASVVLRSATSLRIPEVITSITIPPALRIHRVLSQKGIGEGLLNLASISDDPKGNLLVNLRLISRNNPITIDPATITEIERTDSTEIELAIKDLLVQKPRNKTGEEVKEEEFTAIREAAENGYPPHPSEGPMFEVDKNAVIKLNHSSGLCFRITPVKRLQVIMVQKGYRRPVRGPTFSDGTPIRLIETYYPKDDEKWYPGVRLLGEGIFLDLYEDNPALNDDRAKLWFDRYNQFSGESEAYFFHPLFVWWHTLSHRIIRGLSLDSGYSSAAIRERIYFKPKMKNRRALGGILLYTSQSGSDGSLGGLIALCNNNEFDRILKVAERNINACSNDPLCSEHLANNNGAACYACLLTSETSCEFHNTFLDRMLLAETFSLGNRIK